MISLLCQNHPERNNAPGTKDRFTIIAEAYDVLSDGISSSKGERVANLNIICSEEKSYL